MKQKPLHVLFRQILCWLMAVHVLNFSLNAPDYQLPGASPAGQRESLSVNEIENVFELVVEKWLDCDNALPEQDEPDGDDESQSFIKEYYPPLAGSAAPTPLAWVVEKELLPELTHSSFLHYSEITSPPPQA